MTRKACVTLICFTSCFLLVDAGGDMLLRPAAAFMTTGQVSQVGFGEVLDGGCLVAKKEVQRRTGPFAILILNRAV